MHPHTHLHFTQPHAHYSLPPLPFPLARPLTQDPNTFASASLDRTIKVWSLGNPIPNFTLEGHERGVNCVDYYTGGEGGWLVGWRVATVS
jgi:WD40 repeat protein